MYFSVCVVAPPGERSVGAGRGEAVRRGVEVSVEGSGGCSRANIGRDFPCASVAYIAWRRMWFVSKGDEVGWVLPCSEISQKAFDGSSVGGLGEDHEANLMRERVDDEINCHLKADRGGFA